MKGPFIIDPLNKSWIKYSQNSKFPIQNLPLGIFSTLNSNPSACSIIGDSIIDLFALANDGYIILTEQQTFDLNKSTLNDFFRNGKTIIRSLRSQLVDLFEVTNEQAADAITKYLYPVNECKLHLPIQIGDYTDFYSSREHATNVGIMFRDPANALLPNWLHLPVGYHGRSSSIIVSGEDIKRPYGQTRPDDNAAPVYGPSKQLDFELEMAFVIGKENNLSEPIPITEAHEHIQGLMLFNDWSARDIQKWEYVPLGPFLGKNFASSVSPWIIDLDAIEVFKTSGPVQNPKPLAYLQQEGENNYDIHLEVYLNDNLICQSNTKYLYWSMDQQLAHHTVNGCNMRIGDLCASGTISGPTENSFGSMLELAWKGTKPIKLADGTERKFLLDGDTLSMKAFAKNEFYSIGFGEVNATVLS